MDEDSGLGLPDVALADAAGLWLFDWLLYVIMRRLSFCSGTRHCVPVFDTEQIIRAASGTESGTEYVTDAGQYTVHILPYSLFPIPLPLSGGRRTWKKKSGCAGEWSLTARGMVHHGGTEARRKKIEERQETLAAD